MSEFEPRPAAEPEGIDWRRLEVALGRFNDFIASGIAQARSEHREIDSQTARCIAHVLGRAYGRDSALATFGRTEEGGYPELRDEYLDLYNHANVDLVTKELIDWLGTHFVERENAGSGRRFMNEHLPPKLERILVRTGVDVGDWHLTVHVPAIYNQAAIDELTQTLAELQVDQDPALRAFLGLPDVNAMSGDIMQDFHDNYIGTFSDIEDAVTVMAEVDEIERDIRDYAEQRHLFIDGIMPDYEALREVAENGYEFVESEGRVYVFYK